MTQAATPFVAESIAGPRCGGCRLTEQTCAREYPCCENCTHFAEPERPLDLTPDRPRQEPPMTTPIRDTITDLLARARPITDSKIRRAVARVDQAHAQLREALTDHEGKAAARREVERLERQLAEARSKLRGGSTAPRNRGNRAPEEPVPCRKGCGRMCNTAAGRVSHERNCTGQAA